MTDKEKVLAKWPDAYAYKWVCELNPQLRWWFVCRFEVNITAHREYPFLGDGETAFSAWADAARRLSGAEGE